MASDDHEFQDKGSMSNKSYPLDICTKITGDGSNHEVAVPLTFALLFHAANFNIGPGILVATNV